MEAFSYLSVLISIILGLAIAQVLQGYRQLLLARTRVQHDAVPLVWSGLVLLFAAQAWWASFGLNARKEWNFADFAVILVQMGLLYMLSALILPDAPPKARVDVAEHFEQHRRPFFVFLIAMLMSSIAKDAVLEHRLTSPLNLCFHLLLAAIAVAGIFCKARKAQLGLALFAAIGSLVYVTLLFARL